MPDQPTPKPLTAEQESALRLVLLDARPHIDSVAPSRVVALLATLDTARAESAALRAAVAEAEKRIEMLYEPISACDRAAIYSDDQEKQADYWAGFHAGIREAKKRVGPIIDRERANEGPGDINVR